MWTDSEGVAHTVVLADPGLAFAPEVLSTVTGADESERAELREVLDELMSDLYEELETPQRVTDDLVEVPIPEGLVGRNDAADEQSTVVDRTRRALTDVPFEFRLDALLALEDLLDSFAEEED
ncbi:hypothetical protein [Promicromonospora sukumoe]